jgi:hypothetical protein
MLVQLVLPVTLDQPARQVQQVLPVTLDQPAQRQLSQGPLDQLVLKEKLVQLAQLAHKVLLDQLVHKDHRVFKEFKARKV